MKKPKSETQTKSGDRLGGPNARSPAEIVASVMEERYSCRSFKPDPVPRALVEQILCPAQRAANWCNTQPWQLVITEGEATRAFAKAMHAHASSEPPTDPDIPPPEEYIGIYRERRRAVALQLYEAVGITMGDRQASKRQTLENFRFFNAPHVAIVTSERKLGTYGVLDCGLFISNFVNLATGYGLGTIVQAAPAMYGGFVHRYFDIPQTRLVLCAISFGWPDADHPANRFRTPRAKLDEVVDFRTT